MFQGRLTHSYLPTVVNLRSGQHTPRYEKMFTNVAVRHVNNALLGANYHPRYRDGPGQIGMVARYAHGMRFGAATIDLDSTRHTIPPNTRYMRNIRFLRDQAIAERRRSVCCHVMNVVYTG